VGENVATESGCMPAFSHLVLQTRILHYSNNTRKKKLWSGGNQGREENFWKIQKGVKMKSQLTRNFYEGENLGKCEDEKKY